MAFYVKKCAYCSAENHPVEITCLRCGKDLPDAKTESENEPLTRPKPKPIPAPAKPYDAADVRPIQVVVTDINMKFASMVGFMVKWAIATIPALIILIFVGFVAVAIFAGLGFFKPN